MEGQVFNNARIFKKMLAVSPWNESFIIDNITTFSNTHELNRQMIHRCLSGECRQHKGWRFSYVNSI